jgi:putative addiction module component (TIGR02574 family)
LRAVISQLWQATRLASQSVTEKEMSTSLEAIQAEVLRLSPSDRSRLLERLIVSLDADAEVEAEWEAVAEAREAEITSGVATAVPLEEAMARLEARFKG